MASGVATLEAEAFLKTVVAFPAVPAGKEPERLLRVIDRLCLELGRVQSAGALPSAGALRRENGISGLLSPHDETLVTSLRKGLAKIAAAAGEAGRPEAEGAVCVALDGAELVIRGELTRGQAGELASLLPSFVFLVTLPVLDQDEALALSHRTSELIDAQLED